ncbi:hypothetical protein BU24DRAFT_448126 [Aaosphaeria arxii CBS 175.79]|uniref:Vps72/YL1 C-terminal domain-containing protein n=1 Tax=Aaosphaeria arxii CBS 175.79 TaxID=1450172 RepID=A0A6A5Y2A7_9PLEO|nr:uncharacterized protein BU24DRAFT_448126 [Aaosphaeria arxii CBS 175.79]KAF2019685.1 hypothetical protein BU24DRAFT_448126 [Aaosphaeria arxii CBS 175.79]
MLLNLRMWLYLRFSNACCGRCFFRHSNVYAQSSILPPPLQIDFYLTSHLFVPFSEFFLKRVAEAHAAPTQYKMAPITTASDEKTHQALLDKLDIHGVHKPYRNPHWKPPQRRNKNVRQIVSDAARKEASVMATQNNSGVSTPVLPHSEALTPVNSNSRQANIAQAAQSLSTLVLERNSRAAMASGPAATYTNIESAPSFHPSSQRRYCDITGLPAPYTDPKTRLRYHNKEIFGGIRTMPQNVYESYLAARGAHTVLK